MITAVYSGTFDPIHIGHAAIAAYISALPEIERVLMLVSPLNPLKQDSTRLFSDRQRLEMARMAMAGDSRIEVSDLESELPRPNYTVNTLNALHTTYPDIAFRLVVGADNLRDIHLWKQPLRAYRIPASAYRHILIANQSHRESLRSYWINPLSCRCSGIRYQLHFCAEYACQWHGCASLCP